MIFKRVFHRRIDQQKVSAGFTLMELLIVVAMTGILAALLMPALSTAKEKSRRTVCRSNLHQLFLVCQYYAQDNLDTLPSAADNLGYYHSIRLSDNTFTNLLINYTGGVSNIFYCPNLVFNAGAQIVGSHDSYGYVIGYSYLADDILVTSKGADYSIYPVKASASPTNVLMADANYWTTMATSFGPSIKMAPHTAMGAAMAATPGPSITNSASLGGKGGNVGLFDGSVTWRTMNSMRTHSASSASDAFDNW